VGKNLHRLKHLRSKNENDSSYENMSIAYQLTPTGLQKAG